MADNKTPEAQKDGLALVVGGLFILALVFAAYNYFSKGTEIEDKTVTTGDTAQEVVAGDMDKNGDGEITAEEVGDVNGDGLADERDVEEATAETDTTADTGELGTGGPTGGPDATGYASWIPNNYSQGDIKAGNYTVVVGDTLWEISEGAYGIGSDWVRILDANSSSIGYLASGVQALIVPGQVLVLP